MRFLHTVEHTSYEWDDSYGDEVPVRKDVIAVFEKFEDAVDYANIHRGVQAVENAIQLDPEVPEHPAGTRPWLVEYNSVREETRVHEASPHDIDGSVDVSEELKERRGVGLVSQQVGRDGTVVRFRATELVAIGCKVKFTCWAKDRSDAREQFEAKWDHSVADVRDN